MFYSLIIELKIPYKYNLNSVHASTCITILWLEWMILGRDKCRIFHISLSRTKCLKSRCTFSKPLTHGQQFGIHAKKRKLNYKSPKMFIDTNIFLKTYSFLLSNAHVNHWDALILRIYFKLLILFDAYDHLTRKQVY